ncbi:hypothetical protein BD289DRAFT_479651 [Coniella lustricola]|uniref:Mediator of RNA polymerase II transcription subunit 18 n=1 Tax=Coniella lustricola TaxID=2025994 RepID=A0A2T3AIM0_9PEZI|nr:hypothetical protein BD289DRAFT_479651 [Coniella lustricola]
MYELFMTAFVREADVNTLLAILSGYAWDSPRHRVHRVLHFAGASPNQPRGITKRSHIQEVPAEPDVFSLGLPNSTEVSQQQTTIADWKQLSDILSKQSYHVTTRYLVHKDGHFGKSEPLPDNYFNTNPGALFWSDMPDPATVSGQQTLVLQRQKIELHDQLNLSTVLTENSFVYKAEHVEEAYDIYHRDDPVEFHLVRCYRAPAQAAGAGRSHGPAATLPALESLEHATPGKWMLTAVAYVTEDMTPDKIQAARDALFKVREDMGPCGIVFKEIDRRHFDTQIAAARKPMSQALGKTQSLVGPAGGAR